MRVLNKSVSSKIVCLKSLRLKGWLNKFRQVNARSKMPAIKKYHLKLRLKTKKPMLLKKYELIKACAQKSVRS